MYQAVKTILTDFKFMRFSHVEAKLYICQLTVLFKRRNVVAAKTERYAYGFTLKRKNLLLPQNGDMYARNQTGSYKGVSFVSFKPSVP